MILTLFSFIYKNKTEEFTKPRVNHTFDNLRCNERCLQNENVLPRLKLQNEDPRQKRFTWR